MATRLVLPFADVGQGVIPSSGATLTFYEVATTTLKNTFSDAPATVLNANPVVANSEGVFGDIFIQGDYKVVLADMNGVQIWEADPVSEFSTMANSIISNAGKNTITMVADPLLVAGDVVTTNSYYDTFISNNEIPLGGANYTIMTLAHFVLATGLSGPDNIIDHLLNNGLVALMDRTNDIHITQAGVIGVVGNPTTGTSEVVRVQAALNRVLAGGAINFSGLETIFIDQPLHIMSDPNWQTGGKGDEVFNVTLNLGGCRIKYTSLVPFTGVYPNTPIHFLNGSNAASEVRSPPMLTCAVDGLVIRDGFLDGNTQSRGVTVGIPSNNDALAPGILLISCEFTTVKGMTISDHFGDGIKMEEPFSITASASNFRNANNILGRVSAAQIQDILVIRCGGSGLNIITASDISITNLTAFTLNVFVGFFSALQCSLIRCVSDVTRSRWLGVGSASSFIQNVYGTNLTVERTGTNNFGGFVFDGARGVRLTGLDVHGGGDLAAIGEFRGDPASAEGSRLCTVSDVSVTQGVHFGGGVNISNNLVIIGGTNNAMYNVKLDPTVGLSTPTAINLDTLIKTVNGSLNFILKGITGDVEHNVGNMFALDSGSTLNLNIQDLYINYTSTIGTGNIVSINSGSDVTFTNLNINHIATIGVDTGRNILSVLGDNIGVTMQDCNLNMGVNTLLITPVALTSNVKVVVDGLRIAQCVSFPTFRTNTISEMSLNNVIVNGFLHPPSNPGGAILVMGMRSGMRHSITNCRLNGVDQRPQEMLVVDSQLSMAALTDIRLVISDNIIIGGDSANNFCAIRAFDVGVLTTLPWGSLTVSELFTCSNNRINNSHNLRLVKSGVAVSNFDFNISDVAGNGSCIIPNSAIGVIDTAINGTFNVRWISGNLVLGDDSGNVISLGYQPAISAMTHRATVL